MSRHRHLDGWVAEAEEEFEDDSYGGAYEGYDEDAHFAVPAGTQVVAKFYEDEEWYPGTVIDHTEQGCLILFDGFEDDGAQETWIGDMELPADFQPEQSGAGGGKGGASVDLETYKERVAQLSEVVGGEGVSEQDVKAALERHDFNVEAAATFLLDWVAAGKPGGFVATPSKPQAPAAKPAPKPKETPKEPEKAKSGGKKGQPKAAAQKAGGGAKNSAGGGKLPGSPSLKGHPASPSLRGQKSGADGAMVWSVTKEMDSMSLGGPMLLNESVSSEANGRDAGSDEEGQAFDYVEPPEDDPDPRDTISLVVVGHVDAGKSTLNGHLLHVLGNVDQRTMHKLEKESKQTGKGSFAFAWVLDGHAEERERGVTIDVGVTYFETEHRRVQLLDAPGHKDFVPNMISGAAQADAAILVIDGSIGEFESGFHSGGQTVEHAILVRSLGIQQLVVAVNKLDTVGFDKDRYRHIEDVLGKFLKQAGYRPGDVTFIPCSGWTGENLKERKDPKLSEWYCGPTLMELIDSLRPAPRAVDMPLRLTVSDVFKTQGLGSCIAGRIEAGWVGSGAQVTFRPGELVAMVKSVERHGKRVKTARAGDSVTVALAGTDLDQLRVGSVLCDVARPIPVVSSFLAQILTFDMPVPITNGFQAVMYLQSVNEPVTLTKLLCTVKKSTGEVLKKKPRALPSGAAAVVRVDAQRPVCLELFTDYKNLGRFTLREAGVSIAAGTVMKIIS